VPDQSGVALRPALRDDRTAIRELLAKTGLFHASEIAVALEVIDVYLDRPGQEDYLVQTAEAEGSVAGYVCFGLNTMTEGTVELYWIAVAPSFQGRGIGSALLTFAEEESRRLGGRMVCSETSSREDYGPTLAFYRHHGYVEAARVTDYYAPGDDKIIFTKQL
jgi:ribosomal protein S18 acetylase RimI-like enzyme